MRSRAAPREVFDEREVEGDPLASSDSVLRDLDAPAPPWRYNPSSWRNRIPICVLGGIAFVISSYMALYQWRLIDGVWDPFFGAQSRQVLDSDVSEDMRGWIGIPDAALGALAYLGDAIYGLAGSTRRWQYRPWMVVLFGIDVIPLGIVSAVLVAMQGTVVGAWCSLCLVTAAISLVLVLLAYDEVWSTLLYLRDVWRRHHSPRVLWERFWGVAPAEPIARARRGPVSGAMWARDLELALALWLAASPWIFGHAAASARLHDLSVAAAVAVAALLSYGRRTRRAHLAELPLAAWLVGYGWWSAAEAATAASQNHVVVGLLLAMLAIVPSEANRPPLGWRAGEPAR
jgi:uncharacterized membrane protein